MARVLVGAVGLLAILSGCASTGDGVIEPDALADQDAIDESVIDASASQRSEGTVEIGEAIYRFAVTCHDLGAGELVVIGAGSGSEADSYVELYLRDFLYSPYIGLRLADGIRLEPSLDSSLVLYRQDDVIRMSAIRFVRDLNLETREATEVGLGEVEIVCRDYSTDLPF